MKGDGSRVVAESGEITNPPTPVRPEESSSPYPHTELLLPEAFLLYPTGCLAELRRCPTCRRLAVGAAFS